MTLALLAPRPLWVAWQLEDRPGGKPTKAPYSPSGRMAMADNPATWGSRPDAERRAAALAKPYGLGGVGIELAPLGDGRSLAGIDLDTCRNVDTGRLERWAEDVLASFDSYAEVSPSLTGTKMFFTYDTDILPELRAHRGTSKFGKQFKQGAGEHSPAIELHLGNRYFCVTDALLPDSTVSLRHVEPARILRLLQTVGPAFARSAEQASTGRKERRTSRADGSHSTAAFHVGRDAVKGGATFEEMCEALRSNPDTAAWMQEKGEACDAREARRIYDKAVAAASNSDDVEAAVAATVERFNDLYLVVNEAGKAVVLQPSFDPVLRRRRFDRLSPRDLQTLYMNERIKVGEDDDHRPIFKTAADLWLRHPEQRQFIHGVTFDPTGSDTRPGVLNLWEGFAVKPCKGDWSLMRDHIRVHICADDPVRFTYLMGWMARLLQHPAQQGEVAVVMRGGEGTGKGTLARALRTIIGHHALAISNAKHLVGNFNAHLRDTVFLFADEAFFAGDRAHVGVLKSIITKPCLTIEGKFQNAIETPNFLHLMMASNEEWVVPAALDARRFLVLEVSEAVKNNHDYFAAIWQQMEAGGYAAMLHDLLAYDLSGFNVRAVPTTAGLQQQQKLSLPTTESWWQDCLARGYVFRSKLGLEKYFGEWLEEISTELLFASYTEFAERRRERHLLSRETLGRFMRKMGAHPKRLSPAPVGEHLIDALTPFGSTHRVAETIEHPRPQGYSLGSLPLAREDFAEATGLATEWGEP